ncbi:MAG: hypothetical protein ACPG51_00470 [Thiolinea sp.]
MNIYQRILTMAFRLLIASYPFLIPAAVIADETEIFYQSDAAKVNANVLFLMDSSGSMDQIVTGSGGKSRMQVMQETFREVMNAAPSNLNIGLMSYANAEFVKGYQWDSIKGVSFPISPLENEAAAIIGSYSAVDNLPDAPADLPVRDFLANVVDSWQPAGYTPIVDSLYEAARYFRGEESVWGKYPSEYNWAAHPSTYTGTPACDSPQTQLCRLEWGECNGTQTACEPRPANTCCNWVEDSSGGYCENEDYSCSVDISYCEHTVCSGSSGSATYNSPFQYQCQSNFLVVMSDGKPEYPFYNGRTADGTGQYPKSAFPDYAHDDFLVPALTPVVDSSKIPTTIPALINSGCTDKPSGFASGTCGPELTQFLATQDQSSDIEGSQTVDTFTVAFGMADEPAGTEYLASLATAENGAYTADNAEELAQAFKDVFGEIEKKSYSFSSPSFSVSEDSLLSHGSDVYVPVFDSKRTPLWSGNLRKFSLRDGGIVGYANGPALTSTGEFDENAQDLWSDQPHGSDVKTGGAASRLPPPDSRKLRTDAGGNSLVEISSATSESLITTDMMSPGEDSRRTEHDLHYHSKLLGGAKLPSDLFGRANHGWYRDCDGVKHTLPRWQDSDVLVNIRDVTTCGSDTVTSAKRRTLLDHVRGYKTTESGDIDTSDSEGRKHMGDILNTKPIVVNYGSKSLVMVGTNEGYLHAIDADTGIEEWAFMPSDLLKNQAILFEDKEEKMHVYGLDGQLTLWNYDANKDGVIDSSPGSNDRRYLFFGMRRGGNMYYSVDISNPTSPKVAWKISPKPMTGAIDAGFSGLGETWSKPTLSKMRIANSGSATGDVRFVLVFGGGYDPKYEEQNPNARGSDRDLGSDVYIVDALTGELIWSVMKDAKNKADTLNFSHSVAGDIRVLDMDNNGELDRLYFADLGGNVWRADIGSEIEANGSSVEFKNTTTLNKIAALGDTGSDGDGDHRKFFYEPDTALRMRGGETIMTISIGSGYRSHPLDLGDRDNFYVLIDRDVFKPRDTSADAIITNDDLKVANPDGSGFGGSILNYPDMDGWYMPMKHHGEKVLASSLTFLDKVMFTTFAQAEADGKASTIGPCSPLVTTSRAYVLDILTGEAVANLNRVETTSVTGEKIKENDSFVVAGFGEILDAPQLIFSKLTSSQNGACEKGDCQQSVSVRIGKLDVPVLDLENTENKTDARYSEMVDLTKLLPRLYWRDNDVSEYGDNEQSSEH